jgi:hypothetical protein
MPVRPDQTTITADDNVPVEKKAALIAGSILVFVAAGLVAWGILEFVLLQ